jgi:hypothetical protein
MKLSPARLRLCFAVASATFGLLISGCATASNSGAMIPKVPTAVKKNSESVSVAVTGGSATSKMGASKIADQDFADAIRAAVTQSGLFARVTEAGKGDYHLDVQIVGLDQPMFGASFTVKMEATWRLLRPDKSVVWEKAIESAFTATMGDSLAGVTRLRLANEGTARKNIEDAIAQLAAIDLK